MTVVVISYRDGEPPNARDSEAELIAERYSGQRIGSGGGFGDRDIEFEFSTVHRDMIEAFIKSGFVVMVETEPTATQ